MSPLRTLPPRTPPPPSSQGHPHHAVFPAHPASLASPPLLVRYFPTPRAYTPVWQAMRSFTDARHPETADELWLLQHEPVFTLGRGADAGHIHDAGDIPVLRSDRGGQVSYHAPGQLVAYPLLDLRRRGIGPLRLVGLLEEAILELLSSYGVAARQTPGARGVYAREYPHAKLASVGLRIRRGCSMHGVALNVALPLEPFTRIDPCGMPGLAIGSLAQLLGAARTPTLEQVARRLADTLQLRLAALAASAAHATPATQANPAHAIPAAQANPAHATPATQANPAHATPATQANPAHAIPATQANPTHAIPAAQANPAHAIPATQANPARAIPAAQANPARAILATQANPARATLATQANPTRAIPAIQANPARAVPATQANPAHATPATQANPARAILAAQANPAHAIPATQANPARAVPATQANPAVPAARPTLPECAA